MSELLVLLAIGLFMWLLNVFLPARLKRRQNEVPRGVGPQVPPIVPHPRPLPPLGVAPCGTPVPAEGLPVATRQRVPWRPGSRREIRRGIVLMTLLGPCRALEPPEPPR